MLKRPFPGFVFICLAILGLSCYSLICGSLFLSKFDACERFFTFAYIHSDMHHVYGWSYHSD